MDLDNVLKSDKLCIVNNSDDVNNLNNETNAEESIMDVSVINNPDENGGGSFDTYDPNKPLHCFKRMLEQNWSIDLSEYCFLYRGNTLDENKTLNEQKDQPKFEVIMTYDTTKKIINMLDASNTNDIFDSSRCPKWVEDIKFRDTLSKRNIPLDPYGWDINHVQYWLKWAIENFKLVDVILSDWNLSGREVCNLTCDEFKKRIPFDDNNQFWIHLQILRKYKLVATNNSSGNSSNSADSKFDSVECITSNEKKIEENQKLYSSNKIQLWQFLLELLMDKAYSDIIRWKGNDGEFHLVQPTVVAQLWGIKKCKQNMTYDKLSRSLRYYYYCNHEIIRKVANKRGVYKFTYDLKDLIGYSPMELQKHMS